MKKKIVRLKKYKNSKGVLLKYIDKSSPLFRKFGEIYFNQINQNKKSDWIFHKKNQCLLTVINGKIRFEIITKKKKKEKVTLSTDNYKLLALPKKTWFRFVGLERNSILVNLIEHKHDDKEVIKKINHKKI